MSIETLDDVLEDLANALGIYGAHDDESCDSRSLRYSCRCCFTAILRIRIEEAVEVERKLRT